MPGRLAQAIRDSGILDDIGRNAAGVGDALLTVGSGIVAQPIAGLLGLTQRSPDAAADVIERTTDALTYRPRTREGQDLLANVGGVVERASNAVANTTAGHAINEGLYDLSAAHPGLMALAAGAVGSLGAPEAAPERAILNVGLRVGEDAYDAKNVLKALKKRGIGVERHSVGQSSTEPTSIVTINRALADAEARDLADELGQQAIAQKVGNRGLLHGAMADEWGPFNEDEFLSHEAPYKRYAEEYPPIAPPEMKFDKKRNRPYEGRGESDITRNFKAQRLKIQRQIDEYGIDEPYFPPEERFDVDPANYPREQDTLTHGLPKKQATVDKWRAKIQTDDARRALQNAFDNGIALGGNEHWYKMGQLEREFVDELGPEEGRKAFHERFARAMASTTAGSSPEMNLMLAHYGNFMRAKGLPAETRTITQPVPTIDLMSNMKSYNRVINEGQGLSAEANPKRYNFEGDFEGHADPSTIDEQMTDIITPGEKAPPGDSYFAYQELINEMAKKNGVDPRYFQEVAWGGHKGVHGKPMIQIVNEAIERTHRLTGMPKRDIVRRGLIRAEIPLYGVVGAGLLSPFLTNREESPGA